MEYIATSSCYDDFAADGRGWPVVAPPRCDYGCDVHIVRQQLERIVGVPVCHVPHERDQSTRRPILPQPLVADVRRNEDGSNPRPFCIISFLRSPVNDVRPRSRRWNVRPITYNSYAPFYSITKQPRIRLYT